MPECVLIKLIQVCYVFASFPCYLFSTIKQFLFAYFCFYLNVKMILGTLYRDLHPHIQLGTDDVFPQSILAETLSVFVFLRAFNSNLVELHTSLYVVWLSQCKLHSPKMLLIHFTVFALNVQHIFSSTGKLGLENNLTSTCMHIILTLDSPKGIQDRTKLPFHYSPS